MKSIQNGQDQTPDSRITASWLRAAGFQWSQIERQPSRHWTLWVGEQLPTEDDRVLSRYSESFGVEVARVRPGEDDAWFVWFRADYAGRYSRFISAGVLTRPEQLTGLIAGLIGRPFDNGDVVWGALRDPARAVAQRAESGRIDHEIEEARTRRIVGEEADMIRRVFRGSDWFNRVEIEDERSVVVIVNRWPSYEERKGLPASAGIELDGRAS